LLKIHKFFNFTDLHGAWVVDVASPLSFTRVYLHFSGFESRRPPPAYIELSSIAYHLSRVGPEDTCNYFVVKVKESCNMQHARCGPEDSRKFRLPYFMTFGT
jgi:hypothetical protein